jgi:predicted O-methyltransferase YrrM
MPLAARYRDLRLVEQMMNLLKQSAEAILPRRVFGALQIRRERLRLAKISGETFDAERLGTMTRRSLMQALDDSSIAREWLRDEDRISRIMPFADIDGGICPGERRALYHLVASLKPARVLEIGTHIGASTLAIARSLATHSDAGAHLTTVDIADVNDPACGAFARLGLASPRESLERAGLSDRVTFVAKASSEFLLETDGRFDLIFLDGDHAAPAVYRELAQALNCLTPNGAILLHDFYPDGKPLYPNGLIEPGPVVAAERITAECEDIGFLPFGELPWEAKQGVRTTSLAFATNCVGSVRRGSMQIH